MCLENCSVGSCVEKKSEAGSSLFMKTEIDPSLALDLDPSCCRYVRGKAARTLKSTIRMWNSHSSAGQQRMCRRRENVLTTNLMVSCLKERENTQTRRRCPRSCIQELPRQSSGSLLLMHWPETVFSFVLDLSSRSSQNRYVSIKTSRTIHWND